MLCCAVGLVPLILLCEITNYIVTKRPQFALQALLSACWIWETTSETPFQTADQGRTVQQILLLSKPDNPAIMSTCNWLWCTHLFFIFQTTTTVTLNISNQIQHHESLFFGMIHHVLPLQTFALPSKCDHSEALVTNLLLDKIAYVCDCHLTCSFETSRCCYF